MNARISLLVLLFTFNIVYVNAQLVKGKTAVPILTKNGVKTLKDNPQKIKGTLIAPSGEYYFFTDKRYFRYSKDNGLEKIANTKPNWLGIPDNIDAVFVNTINKKAYFFKGSKYNRYDFEKGNDNPELAISRFWKGVPNDVDAITNHTNGRIYFFKGDTYYRYDSKLKKVDKSGLISKNWKGVPNNLAAALLHKNGRIYFFKGNKYYRFNIKSARVDKVGTIGRDGWKGLDFNKKNFTKKIVRDAAADATASTKNNIRLKVTLTRVKSIQARDSDDIADFLLEQSIEYSPQGKRKIPIKNSIKRYKFNSDLLKKYNEKKDEEDIDNLIIRSLSHSFHIREGDENHYINNSLIYELTPQEIKDKRAEFKFHTDLAENDGEMGDWFTDNIFKLFSRSGLDLKTIARNHYIDVNIYEVLDYLQNPNLVKYGKSYFKGGRGGDMHEYGAFGDVMWFKKGSNNSLIGHLEFGDNNKESYVRFYYRFELVN